MPKNGEKYRELAPGGGAPFAQSLETGGFLAFSRFGTAPADYLAWLRGGPEAGSGRPTMTLSFNNLQQLAASVIGAVLVGTLFISAAIGPVPIV
jgi:hypothetical protein